MGGGALPGFNADFVDVLAAFGAKGYVLGVGIECFGTNAAFIGAGDGLAVLLQAVFEET